MNKAELLKAVSNKTGLTKKEAGNVVNAATKSITDELFKGGKVTIAEVAE